MNHPIHFIIYFLFTDQRLDLHRFREEDNEIIKGQIVIMLLSRDGNNRNILPNVVIAENGTLLHVNGTGEISNERQICSTGQALGHTSRSYIEGEDDLPEGWTECRTSNGRIYYMNHVTRTTQWIRPTLPASTTVSNTPSRPVSSRSGQHSSRHHHYHNHQTQSSIDSTNSVTSSNSAPASGTILTNQSRGHQGRRSTRHRNYLARNQLHEAVMSALTTTNGANTNCTSTTNELIPNSNSNLPPMPAGYEMHTTEQGQVYFVHSETGVSTWNDPRVPRELLVMPNINLDELVGPLGTGWEVRHTPNGRKYFVDHQNRTTQFTDPRMIIHSAVIVNLIQSLNSNQTYSHLQYRSQSSGNLVSDSRHQRNNLKFSSNSDSLQALKNGIALLPFNQQQKRRNLVQKMSILRQELQAFQPQSGHDIFEDSYRGILKMRPKDLRKRLMIKFRSEEGLDYGGIAREWLYLLSHEMLNPYYGLFQYTRDDIYTLQINPDSSINPVSLFIIVFISWNLYNLCYSGSPLLFPFCWSSHWHCSFSWSLH